MGHLTLRSQNQIWAKVVRAHRRTVPFPPVRTVPAIFCSLSTFICETPGLNDLRA